MAVSSILLGQVWQMQSTGETWLVTKVYSEVFTSYRRVKVDKASGGVALPGFVFTQETDTF